jgi:hypothetical protein
MLKRLFLPQDYSFVPECFFLFFSKQGSFGLDSFVSESAVFSGSSFISNLFVKQIIPQNDFLNVA